MPAMTDSQKDGKLITSPLPVASIGVEQQEHYSKITPIFGASHSFRFPLGLARRKKSALRSVWRNTRKTAQFGQGTDELKMVFSGFSFGSRGTAPPPELEKGTDCHLTAHRMREKLPAYIGLWAGRKNPTGRTWNT